MSGRHNEPVTRTEVHHLVLGLHASVRSAAMAPSIRRIPEATVARLPVYQRLLLELVRAGTATVSSERLAELARVNASKVRKDLSFLGSFGTRGSGYDAQYLLSQIDRELGLDGDWPVVIVGLGNLGRALANSPGFTSRGFRIAGLFDVDPNLVGTRVRGVTISHADDLEKVCLEDPPTIGVIATPAADGQAVADRFVRAGMRSILNFAPRVLTVPPDVMLRYVDLSIELQVISFYLSHRDNAGGGVASAVVPHPVGLTSAEPA
ncbi:MAG TPA: redox-sensing transcriptional repressor Rex [Acidimicrobiales bacterium]|nr:redox-sensing transcriptional repressor Rex [Acidimicrobiales bacterium]